MSRIEEILQQFPTAINKLKKQGYRVSYEPVKKVFFLRSDNEPLSIMRISQMEDMEIEQNDNIISKNNEFTKSDNPVQNKGSIHQCF